MTVTKAPTTVPDPLTIIYSEAEVWSFNKLSAAQQARGFPWQMIWELVIVYAFGTGLVVVGAYYAGLLEQHELRKVLVAAYLAFAAGVATYAVVMRVHHRYLARESYRIAGYDSTNWELSFDAAGLIYRADVSETRVPWRAMTAINEHDAMVAIWFGRMQSLPIPARVFRADSARAEFIAWVDERIKAAKRA